MRIGLERICCIDFLPASISLLHLNCFNVLTFEYAPIARVVDSVLTHELVSATLMLSHGMNLYFKLILHTNEDFIVV